MNLASSNKPKASLKVSKIREVKTLDDAEIKKFKKTKKDSKAQSTYFKVVFDKSALIKNKDVSKEAEDSEEDEKEDIGKNENTWYFQCQDKEQRDTLMSQVAINTKNAQINEEILKKFIDE